MFFARALRTTTRPLLSRATLAPTNLHARWITDQAREAISSAVKAHPVVLFMKGNPSEPRCGFSRAVSQVLAAYEVPPEKFKSYDVLQDQELRQSIKEYSDWPTIPQLYVKGEFVGGCDIVMDMHKSGQLETLLEDSGIIPKIELPEEKS
ncbi:Monothiol glutaredoxin-5, mitochondrial Flags: Precursor [Serendipita indica DSM 11827]|uniref:Monothiol glutaredoxin-5, mitochondrial n=1 Tax=Serendipita indica (strain DSM 11827) TaxID=1109443 RepID=G4TA88_SERID|nr:Monothiol glutaredoxin-5, mitochondrial Flags: Precursor [Serendipita indica DSM 11827]CCA68239.1 probable GRX5-glutaredoxin [Serendipita indica DSM 11827]